MSKPEETEEESHWLVRFKKTGPYIVGAAIGGLVMAFGNFTDSIGKIYDRLKTPEAFVLAENTAKSNFSDQLARRAWLRLFWADNFRARVISRTPMSDINSSWNAYINSDADWNANLMNSIVGLERYYGASRSAQLEGKIQMLFQQLDDELAALRRSDIVKELRVGKEPDATQQADVVTLAQRAAKTTETLRTQLYALVRCFPPDNKNENLC